MRRISWILLFSLLYFSFPKSSCAEYTMLSADESIEYLEFSFVDGKGYSVIGYYGEPETLTIPSEIDGIRVDRIASGAFKGCQSLKEVWIANGVDIDSSAFEACSYLEKVKLPEHITSIASYTFWMCNSLKSITIPDGVTIINDGAFRNCVNMESVTFPKNLIRIDYCAFMDCYKLKEVDLPSKLEVIGHAAFSACDGLSIVRIPSSVKTIEDRAFAFCSLDEVYIPESVEEIHWNAFYYGGTLYCVKGSPADLCSAFSDFKRVYVEADFFFENNLSPEETAFQTSQNDTEADVSWLDEASAEIPEQSNSLYSLLDWSSQSNTSESDPNAEIEMVDSSAALFKEDLLQKPSDISDKADLSSDTIASMDDLSSASENSSDSSAEKVTTGKALGYGGELQLEIHLNNGVISEILVIEEWESNDVGKPALETLCKKIIETNSADVDNISGATITSKAVKKAVKSALNQID